MRLLTRKKSRSVPKGYRHLWTYQKGLWDERKTQSGKWKFDYRVTKKKKSRNYGKFRKGFKIKWKINAIQYATKTGKGTYKTRMIGTKVPLAAGYKRLKRIKNYSFSKRSRRSRNS